LGAKIHNHLYSLLVDALIKNNNIKIIKILIRAPKEERFFIKVFPLGDLEF